MFRSIRTAILAATGTALGAAVLGGALMSTTTPASAEVDPPWPNGVYGVPTDFEAGATNGWYFWKDLDGGFRLCSTTPSALSHPLEATLITNGTFHDVEMVAEEEADDIRLSANKKRLTLRFDTHNGVDCAIFKTTGTRLNLRLKEFGHLVPKSHIFVGHDNSNPPANPWTIRR
ncbi:MAG: hypothetical protein ACKVVT_16905 [Dehalococcoidia bacterium]